MNAPGLAPLGLRAHPWHGVDLGAEAPDVVTAYIEIVPTDTVKYELDKASGILRVDRPQRYSNVCPSLYGFLPRTYCAERIAARCMERTGLTGIRGDGDPLDLCVLTESVFSRSDLLVRAVPIGGLRMVDGQDADDKIVAVLWQDATYGHLRDLADLPPALLDRLRHYFLTYKLPPGARESPVSIPEIYGRDEAHEVIRRSQADYLRHFS
jgi:inorganic pyrophosphatase